MKVPLGLLFLDLIGTVLMGVGAAALADIHLIPAGLQFPGYPVVLIVVGLALAIPFVVALVRRR